MSYSNSAYDIYTSNGILPIENLFKAIYVLQKIEECEDEVELLSRKLEKCFEKVEEKNAVKRYENVRYMPTGLAYLVGEHTNIILSPWTPQTKARKKVDPREKVYYSKIRDYLTDMWYYQVKNHLKQGLNADTDFNPRESLQLLERLEILSNEEKSFLNISDIEHKAWKEIDNLKDLFRSNHDNDFFFLDEGQLEELIACVKLGAGDEWDTTRKVREYEAKPVKDAIKLDLSVLKTGKNLSGWDNDYNRYTYKYENLKEALSDIIDQIDKIEDPTINKIFKKLKLK